ncbi:MAG: LysM peptidoglycan-binding domain-containing protein [Saprospiraceae bacterium]|nr:LysM peptidoglycan-binding domain-containing protein [Saprospiraceae bacterium]MCB9326025.1 LysM peptidoglycan-binding domain-containing protein [Lewinellaceae bacterium]
MSLQDKYRSVLNLGEELEVKEGSVEESDGKLKIRGLASTQYHKNLLWDEIKKVGGESPSDLMADIKVENTDYYHKHTVAKGETLGKISKQYYGKPGHYMAIFNANTDILKDPNMIHPDQELVIPFPED